MIRQMPDDAFPELMGAAEVAGTLGVSVHNLNAVVGLPKAVAQLRATRVWIADDVRAFAVEFKVRRRQRVTPAGGSRRPSA